MGEISRNNYRILVVDDDDDILSLISLWLSSEGFEVITASSGEEALTKLAVNQAKLVITDLYMGGMSGIELLAEIHGDNPLLPVIMLSGQAKIPDAVKATHLGSAAFLTKPLKKDELIENVNHALRISTDQQSASKISKHIIYQSKEMTELMDLVLMVADSNITVFISGATGTGKEVIAKAIHDASPRRDGPFVAVNCGAIPEQLLESELFGHEKGAFTGAIRQRCGRFELAHKGTLFLDEIGEISPVVQIKLLRVLQERQFERVGGNETINVDVRLVCATQKDLRKEVEQGRFREDLYYRLNVVPVQLPPLRERREDILTLAQHFLKTLTTRNQQEDKTLSRQAREVLFRYGFPGNVRELENTIERAVALAQQSREIQVADLCGQSQCPYSGGEPQKDCGFCGELDRRNSLKSGMMETLAGAREQFERNHILEILQRTGWSRTTAAKVLGLSRKGLWDKCKRSAIVRSGESAGSDRDDWKEN